MANKTIISTRRISSIHTTQQENPRPSKNNPTKIRGHPRCSARVLPCWSCKYMTSIKSYTFTCQNKASFEKKDLFNNCTCTYWFYLRIFYVFIMSGYNCQFNNIILSFRFLKIWIALNCMCVRSQSNLLDWNDWGLCLDPRNAQINDTFTLLFYDQHK